MTLIRGILAATLAAAVLATAGAGLTEWSEEPSAAAGPAVEWDRARDRADILDVLNRHQIYIDLRDVDAYSKLYAEDGVYESFFGSAAGRSEISAMSLRLHASGFTDGMRHFGGPALVQVDGDRATALSYWMVVDVSGKPSIQATGTYRDELRKRDGRWEIVRRVLEQDGEPLQE